VSEASEVALGLGCLALMIGLTVWGRGPFRLYSVLIGSGVGYLAAAWFGWIPDEAIELLRTADFLDLPQMQTLHAVSFDWLLVAPFLIAAVSSVVKTIGDLSTSQKINDDRWVTPEMNSIRRGVLADALAVFSAGMLGGVGQSTSSSNVGLALATGVTSRVVGFYAGAAFVAFAFVPTVAMAFVVMPTPVKGAILVFVACFMIVAGLQLITSRLLDARKIFTVGAAMVAGLSVDMAPSLYRELPAVLHSITASSMAVATVVAILLNLAFRIGISRRAVLDVHPEDNGAEKVAQFLLDRGAAWGARADVINRAVGALTEFVDVAAPLGGRDRRIRVNARYDEVHLDLFLLYGGDPVVLPISAPTSEQVAADPGSLRLLSGYIIRTAATSHRATRRGDVHLLHLRFEH
jgi:NCS2 family nucleobase:cation symporter-2